MDFPLRSNTLGLSLLGWGQMEIESGRAAGGTVAVYIDGESDHIEIFPSCRTMESATTGLLQPPGI